MVHNLLAANRMRSHLFLVAFTMVGLFTAACVSRTPGAQPHDLSAAQHATMAANEETSAQLHSAQFNPDAAVREERCRGGRTNLCWTSVMNPTTAHREEAKNHERMAADHRAGSRALRDAEASACVGLAEEDRDTSPFERREDIAGVEPLTATSPTLPYATYGTVQVTRTEGAVITFRAVPGMTAPWLQRIVDCHLARNAALGHYVPEMPNCPLVPKDATAKVTATDAGFAVAVRSDKPDMAKEILRRSLALVAR